MDVARITSEFSKIPIESDEEGLIPAFGVYLTKLPGTYYAMVSYQFEDLFTKETTDSFVIEAARQLLIEAGHVCGFNTFGGIMKSDAWKAIVLPMITKQEDWVRGMVAVINVLGWGVYEIEDLSPDKLVLKITNSYEADFYVSEYGNSADHGKCYLAVGASVSLMSLVFHADISQDLELNPELYDRLFKDHKVFHGEEPMCIAKGDPYCQVVITRE